MTLRKLSPYFLVLALGGGCTAKRTVIVDAPVVQSDCGITQASREIEGDKKDARVVAEHHQYLGWDNDCGAQREKELKHEISFKLLVEALSAPGVSPQKKSEIAEAILSYLRSDDFALKNNLQRAMEEKNITVRDINIHVIPDPHKKEMPPQSVEATMRRLKCIVESIDPVKKTFKSRCRPFDDAQHKTLER